MSFGTLTRHPYTHARASISSTEWAVAENTNLHGHYRRRHFDYCFIFLFFFYSGTRCFSSPKELLFVSMVCVCVCIFRQCKIGWLYGRTRRKRFNFMELATCFLSQILDCEDEMSRNMIKFYFVFGRRILGKLLTHTAAYTRKLYPSCVCATCSVCLCIYAAQKTNDKWNSR